MESRIRWDRPHIQRDDRQPDRAARIQAGLEVRNDIEPFMGFISQYGVFEIRAKMMNSLGNMCAWWLVGIQDTPEQDVEVDVFENALNFGNVVTASLYAHRDPLAREQHFIYDVGEADLSNEFHLYTFEWTPEGFVFYFDDEEIGTFQAEVVYPMISILSAYEGRENWWVGPFDPDRAVPESVPDRLHESLEKSAGRIRTSR